ncbi:hypothetical protein [Catellatospora sp. NPDC049609]|uniref:hypothetical protein n=1 Tax=Catellatospora sp. NPDC049609 TaxID=3155505 RepID=UPI00344A31FD
MSSQGPGTRLGLGAVVIAAGVAAAAGAAQLGIGYGLGVFSWVPTVGGSGEAAWLASLAWTVWISAVSVVLGAVVADRFGVPAAQPSTAVRALRRTALAVAAAVGGLLVVALTAVPARVAERADTFAPHVIVGGYAIAGVLIGLFVAVAALVARAIAANVLATGGWLWLLAVTAAVDGIAAGREPVVAQLGVWPVTADGPWFRSLYLPGAAIAAVSALLIGFLAALPAVRRRDGQAGVVLSGAAGPALVALAYLLAAPKLTGVAPEQLSAHLVAPYAVVTGLIGAVLAQLLAGPRRPRAPKPVAAAPAPSPEPAFADLTAPLAVPAQPVPAQPAAASGARSGRATGTAAVPQPAADRDTAQAAVPAPETAEPPTADSAAAAKADRPAPTPPKNGPRQGRPRKG